MINPGLYEKMEKLDELRSRANLGVILIGASLIIFFPSMAIFPFNGLCIFAVLLAGLGFFFMIGLKEKYKRLYKELFVEETLKENFENVIYLWKSGFTKQQIMNFRLFALGTKYNSEDYLRARYHGTEFEMADVVITDTMQRNSKIIFKGRVIVFDFPDKKIEPTRVYSDNFTYTNTEAILHSEKIKTESMNFNNSFHVYAENPHDAFYLLTPHFMERLMVIKPQYESLAICFENNKVIFAFYERTNDAFDGVMLSEKVSYAQEMEKVQRDINDIKYIIDTINHIGG